MFQKNAALFVLSSVLLICSFGLTNGQDNGTQEQQVTPTVEQLSDGMGPLPELMRKMLRAFEHRGYHWAYQEIRSYEYSHGQLPDHISEMLDRRIAEERLRTVQEQIDLLTEIDTHVDGFEQFVEEQWDWDNPKLDYILDHREVYGDAIYRMNEVESNLLFDYDRRDLHLLAEALLFQMKSRYSQFLYQFVSKALYTSRWIRNQILCIESDEFQLWLSNGPLCELNDDQTQESLASYAGLINRANEMVKSIEEWHQRESTFIGEQTALLGSLNWGQCDAIGVLCVVKKLLIDAFRAETLYEELAAHCEAYKALQNSDDE